MQPTRYYYSPVRLSVHPQDIHLLICPQWGILRSTVAWHSLPCVQHALCVYTVCMRTYGVGAALRCKSWQKMAHRPQKKPTLKSQALYLCRHKDILTNTPSVMCHYRFLLLLQHLKVVSVQIYRTWQALYTDINILNRSLGVAFYRIRNFPCKPFMYNWTVEHWE